VLSWAHALSLVVGAFVVAAVLTFFGAQSAPLIVSNSPGTINQLSSFAVSGREVRVASTTADFRVPSLTSCNMIDTDNDGVLACGVSAGGSDDSFTHPTHYGTTTSTGDSGRKPGFFPAI
jgi:hypothetical protein